MAIFFNWLGFAWLIFALGAAIGMQNSGIFVSPGGNNFGLVVCSVVLLFDIAYRFFVTKARMRKATPEPTGLKLDVCTHWLLAPSYGGSLMFLPAWSTAVIAFLVITFVLGR